jgi:phosphoglucosamine mutase
MLKQEGWDLGGEASGHIICLDKSSTGDGIIAALQVLQAMVGRGQPLAELKTGMDIFPQTMVNVRLPGEGTPQHLNIDRCPTIQTAVRAAESELSHRGRVVLRPSGTEPVIRVMVEGSDAQQVARIGQELAEAVKSAAFSKELKRASG